MRAARVTVVAAPPRATVAAPAGLSPHGVPGLSPHGVPGISPHGVPGVSPREAPVVVVAHGSRDPAAAAATRALAGAVAAARPGLVVRPAYLDHAGPRPGEVLAELADRGHPEAVVVPLLLTSAYHDRVDLPAAISQAEGLSVIRTGVLGPVPGAVPSLLVAALRQRLAEATARSRGEARVGPGSTMVDGVVLAAAGTRDAAARATVVAAAAALGAALGVPWRVGYASAAAPTAGESVAELRAVGARRVGMAAYFLAPGQLYRVAAGSARAAGAVVVAEPLRAAAALVQLVLARVDRCRDAVGVA